MTSSTTTESAIEIISELPALVPEQESLGFLLTDNLRLTRRIAARYFEQYNMTLAQARALLGVFRWQGIRQVDLADFMEIQPISLARLLDQLAGFCQTDIPVGEGVTQSIESMRVFGFAFHEFAQQTFHLVKAIELFADHGQLGHQFGVLRVLGQSLLDQVVSA